MQATKKNNLYRYLGISLKAIVLALTFWFVYDRIFSTENLSGIIAYFQTQIFEGNQWSLFALAMILIVFNWGMEAIKWRFLILKIEKLSLLRAFKAILSGVTVSVFTPNRIGEYAGRVVYINKADRIKAALITVISSISQLIVTIVIGGAGVIFFWKWTTTLSDMNLYLLIQFYVVFVVLLVFVFVHTPFLSIILSRIKFLRERYKKYIEVFSYYTQRELSYVLFLSLIRYVVFTLQYFLLFRFFQVEISFLEALVFIPVYLITLTAIPTISLAELGVREVVVITVFSSITANELGLVSTTFTIWLLNLAIPAIIGVIFVLRARLFKGRK